MREKGDRVEVDKMGGRSEAAEQGGAVGGVNISEHNHWSGKHYWFPYSEAQKRNPVFKTVIEVATGTVSKYLMRISFTCKDRTASCSQRSN